MLQNIIAVIAKSVTVSNAQSWFRWILEEDTKESNAVEKVVGIVKYAYSAAVEDEISIEKGEHLVNILPSPDGDQSWLMVTTIKGDCGLIPRTYVTLVE